MHPTHCTALQGWDRRDSDWPCVPGSGRQHEGGRAGAKEGKRVEMQVGNGGVKQHTHAHTHTHTHSLTHSLTHTPALSRSHLPLLSALTRVQKEELNARLQTDCPMNSEVTVIRAVDKSTGSSETPLLHSARDTNTNDGGRGGKSTQKASSTTSFATGLLICLFSGIFSPALNFGLTFGRYPQCSTMSWRLHKVRREQVVVPCWFVSTHAHTCTHTHARTRTLIQRYQRHGAAAGHRTIAVKQRHVVAGDCGRVCAQRNLVVL